MWKFTLLLILLAAGSPDTWTTFATFTGKDFILKEIDVAGTDIHSMQFKWECPCSKGRQLMISAGKLDKTEDTTQVFELEKSGRVIFDVPDNTGIITLQLNGDKCYDHLHLSVLVKPDKLSVLERKGANRRTVGGSGEPSTLSSTGNVRHFETRCGIVWRLALRSFADSKFRPTVLEKDNLIATFAYDGGMYKSYRSKELLKAYTTAYMGFWSIWDAFRIDSASLYLSEEKPEACTAEIKMSFAGLRKQALSGYQWVAVESNFNYEKELLDKVEERLWIKAERDLDNAVSQLPTHKPEEGTIKAARAVLLAVQRVDAAYELEAGREEIMARLVDARAAVDEFLYTQEETALQQFANNLKTALGLYRRGLDKARNVALTNARRHLAEARKNLQGYERQGVELPNKKSPTTPQVGAREWPILR